jgi:hypothetical protein
VFNRGRRYSAHIVIALSVAVAAHNARAAEIDEELVDPTRPLVLPVVQGADDDDEGGGFGFGLFDEVFTTYELSSVLIRGDVRIAVINGERVRVGEKVGSARVTAIESDSVRLNVDGNIQTLELYKNSIKTLVKGDE